jgi:hypothetical protein
MVQNQAIRVGWNQIQFSNSLFITSFLLADRCHRIGQTKKVTVIKVSVVVHWEVPFFGSPSVFDMYLTPLTLLNVPLQMVAKDTVDADIFEMQERKSKMNAAIMESNGVSSSTTDEKKERKEIMKTVVNRFLSVPTSGNKKNKSMERFLSMTNKENVGGKKDVIDLI